MKAPKKHIKVKGKPVCGSQGTIQFAHRRDAVTCKNCLRATER